MDRTATLESSECILPRDVNAASYIHSSAATRLEDCWARNNRHTVIKARFSVWSKTRYIVGMNEWTLMSNDTSATGAYFPSPHSLLQRQTRYHFVHCGYTPYLQNEKCLFVLVDTESKNASNSPPRIKTRHVHLAKYDTIQKNTWHCHQQKYDGKREREMREIQKQQTCELNCNKKSIALKRHGWALKTNPFKSTKKRGTK